MNNGFEDKRMECGLFLDNCEKELKDIKKMVVKLNWLALNASVEAIHAVSFLDEFEQVIAENVVMQAKEIALLLDRKDSSSWLLSADLNELLGECDLEQVLITDAEGITQYSNDAAMIGCEQSGCDMLIERLKDKEGGHLMLEREPLGNGAYRSKVACQRLDEAGVIQLKYRYEPPKGRLTIDSFSIVAKEVHKQSAGFEENVAGAERKVCAMRALLDDLHSDEEMSRFNKHAKDLIPFMENINQTARLTNLLGIRAKIEAAQSTNDVGEFDKYLNDQMFSQIKLLYNLLPDGEMEYEDIQWLLVQIGLDEVWATDARGLVNVTNSDGGKGFQFTNEGQTGPYMKLLTDKKAVVAAPPTSRALDGKVFKYLGIQRRNGGILQIGRKAELYGQDTAKGFIQVAEEVRSIAEDAKEASERVLELINHFAH